MAVASRIAGLSGQTHREAAGHAVAVRREQRRREGAGVEVEEVDEASNGAEQAGGWRLRTGRLKRAKAVRCALVPQQHSPFYNCSE